MMTKQLNPHQACWAEFLSQFYFSICYQPSKQNTLANTLSQPADQALLDKAHRVQVLLKPEVVDPEINISPVKPINIDPEPMHTLTKVIQANCQADSLTTLRLLANEPGSL